MAVNATELELIEASEPRGKTLMDSHVRLLKNLRVRVDAVLGNAEVTVNELYDFKPDSVIKLNQLVDEPISLVLDGRVVATGTLVAVDDFFGVQITHVYGVE